MYLYGGSNFNNNTEDLVDSLGYEGRGSEGWVEGSQGSGSSDLGSSVALPLRHWTATQGGQGADSTGWKSTGEMAVGYARETGEARQVAGFAEVGRVGGCGLETQPRGTRGEGCFGESSRSELEKANTSGVGKISEDLYDTLARVDPPCIFLES